MYLFLAFNTAQKRGLNLNNEVLKKRRDITGKMCLLPLDVLGDKILVLKYSKNDKTIELIIIEAVEQCHGGGEPR